MRKLRLLLTLLATISMIAFSAYALASPTQQTCCPQDDLTIFTKSGLNIRCGDNHGNDCLSHVTGSGLYTQKKTNGRIQMVTITDSTGAVVFFRFFGGAAQPTIEVRWK